MHVEQVHKQYKNKNELQYYFERDNKIVLNFALNSSSYFETSASFF